MGITASTLIAVGAVVVHAFAEAPARAGDPESGRVKAAQCATCHGPSGISQTPDAPHLAGQSEIYFSLQLKAYRSGKRRHEVMEIVARELKDTDIDDLAAWYASIRIHAEPP